jgi:hypothetical protein
LSDHYVDAQYEEEDPYNPGYYYYQDVLGYSVSVVVTRDVYGRKIVNPIDQPGAK